MRPSPDVFAFAGPTSESMIVSNRVCSDSGRATNASGAASANPASALKRYFVPQISIVNHSSSPSSDDREPVRRMHRLDSPT